MGTLERAEKVSSQAALEQANHQGCTMKECSQKQAVSERQAGQTVAGACAKELQQWTCKSYRSSGFNVLWSAVRLNRAEFSRLITDRQQMPSLPGILLGQLLIYSPELHFPHADVFFFLVIVFHRLGPTVGL